MASKDRGLGNFFLSQHIKIGIIGTTNVGKTTLYNALVNESSSARKALVENSLFTTIEPNVGVVTIKDDRLKVLESLFNDIKRKEERLYNDDDNLEQIDQHVYYKAVFKQATIIDTVGIVEGSRTDGGMGMHYLESIKDCDVILHVVRAFYDNDLTVSYEGDVNPIKELDTVRQELMLSDLRIIEDNLMRIKIDLDDKNGGKKLLHEYVTLLNAYEILAGVARPEPEKGRKGRPAVQRFFPKTCKGKFLCCVKWDELEMRVLKSYRFYSNIEVIYMVNLTSRDYLRKIEEPADMARVKETVGIDFPVLPFSANFEYDLSNVRNDEALEKYMSANPFHISALDRIYEEVFRRLKVIRYYTVNYDNNTKSGIVSSWTCIRQTSVATAGSIITSDYDRLFLTAEVCDYMDLVKHKGDFAQLMKEGKFVNRGRKYVVNDGDIVYYKLKTALPIKKM